MTNKDFFFRSTLVSCQVYFLVIFLFVSILLIKAYIFSAFIEDYPFVENFLNLLNEASAKALSELSN